MTARIRPHLALAATLALVVAACTSSTPEQSATPSGAAPAASQAAASAPPMPAVAGRVRAVGAGDKIVYPDKKVSITLHGGYAYHDNEKIVTSGLRNVAVGTNVFLEGIKKDAHDVKVTSWKWELKAPAFSAAKLDVADPQRPRFLADRTGRYTIKATATNEKGEATTSEIVVNAGVYAGVQTCATCHNGSVQPDIVGQWQQTNHARQLDFAYASYTATSDYCIGCHTTGYNETDTARGFDDRAKAAGWDPAKGSLTEYLVGQKVSLSNLLSSPLGELANIQCEACHGPGGSSHTAVKSFETGVCTQCHPQETQWKASKHATAGRETMHMAENTACVACHTGQGFVEVTVRGNEPIFPNVATKAKPANMLVPTDQPPITCVTCHDPHQATDPGEPRAGHSVQLRLTGDVKMPNGTTVDAKLAAACVSCHANKRTVAYMQEFLDGKQSRGVHDSSQADVLYGVGAIAYGESISNSAHLKAADACVTCHMAASPVMDPGPDGKIGTRDDVKATNIGGHSWNASGKYTGLANGQQVKDKPVDDVAGCNTKGCHAGDPLTSFDVKADADYDGDGTVGTVQEEVKGLLTVLAEKLPKDDKGKVLTANISEKNSTREQRQAMWNYQLIASDGSYGLHNPNFAVQLLQKTYRQLVGSDVPNAKIWR